MGIRTDVEIVLDIIMFFIFKYFYGYNESTACIFFQKTIATTLLVCEPVCPHNKDAPVIFLL